MNKHNVDLIRFSFKKLKQDPELKRDQNLLDAIEIFEVSITHLAKKRGVKPINFAQEIRLIVSGDDERLDEFVDEISDYYINNKKHDLGISICQSITDIKQLYFRRTFYQENFSNLSTEEQAALHQKVKRVIQDYASNLPSVFTTEIEDSTSEENANAESHQSNTMLFSRRSALNSPPRASAPIEQKQTTPPKVKKTVTWDNAFSA